MKRRLVLTASAVANLSGIFEYIAGQSGSGVTGRAFVDGLRNHCRKLSALPGTLPSQNYGRISAIRRSAGT